MVFYQHQCSRCQFLIKRAGGIGYNQAVYAEFPQQPDDLGYYSRIVPFIKMKTPVQADKLPAMQKPSDKLAFMPRNRTLRKTGNILISQNRYIFQLGGKTTQPRS